MNRMIADVVRRAIDVVVSAGVLLLAAPFVVLIWSAVRLTSRGPGFYPATRVGEAGRTYRMWKFRSMTDGRTSDGPAVSLGKDVRVTRIGTWLRATKLDEIPQFWNVLVGQMALVGPRPESPELARFWTPQQAVIARFRPGITGPSQLRYSALEDDLELPDGVSPEDYYVEHIMPLKIRCDLEYMESRTLRSDLRVLLDTGRGMLSIGSVPRSSDPDRADE